MNKKETFEEAIENIEISEYELSADDLCKVYEYQQVKYEAIIAEKDKEIEKLKDPCIISVLTAEPLIREIDQKDQIISILKGACEFYKSRRTYRFDKWRKMPSDIELDEWGGHARQALKQVSEIEKGGK